MQFLSQSTPRRKIADQRCQSNIIWREKNSILDCPGEDHGARKQNVHIIRQELNACVDTVFDSKNDHAPEDQRDVHTEAFPDVSHYSASS